MVDMEIIDIGPEEDVSPEEEVLTVDRQFALNQAASTLFDAMALAEKMNDSETLLNCAAGWLELYERLADNVTEKRPVGFGKFGKREEEDGSTQDNS